MCLELAWFKWLSWKKCLILVLCSLHLCWRSSLSISKISIILTPKTWLSPLWSFRDEFICRQTQRASLRSHFHIPRYRPPKKHLANFELMALSPGDTNTSGGNCLRVWVATKHCDYTAAVCPHKVRFQFWSRWSLLIGLAVCTAQLMLFGKTRGLD